MDFNPPDLDNWSTDRLIELLAIVIGILKRTSGQRATGYARGSTGQRGRDIGPGLQCHTSVQTSVVATRPSIRITDAGFTGIGRW